MKLKNVLLCLCLTTMFGCAKESDPVVLESKEIIVGMECNYSPFNWTTPTNTEGSLPIKGSAAYCAGYDVEISKYISEKLEMNLVIKQYLDFDGLIPALKARAIDMVIAGMSPTEKRKEQVSFSDAYYRSTHTIVVRANDALANATALGDFSGKKIAAQRGTLHDDLVDQIPNVNHAEPLATFPLLAMALSSGNIDGFVSEIPVAKAIIAANPGLTYITFATGNGFEISEEDLIVSIGVRKSNTTLLERINQALAELSMQTREEWMDLATSRSSNG